MKIPHLFLSFLAIILTASGAFAAAPNILILYADDLGFGDLGCYNETSKIPTPHLDQLAADGMRFTDGHSSSGICTPSRYALLTGRHHWRDFHGIVGAMGGSVFAPERLTLPEMLKDQGYQTAAIGKWHLGWDWNAIRKADAPRRGADHRHYDWNKSIPDGPLAHGFDYYFGDTVINFPPYAWIENDKLVKAPDTMMDNKLWPKIKEGNWECRPGPMVTGWDPYDNIPETTRKGVEYINKAGKNDDPFFLYFAYPSPHAPIIPNDEFDGKSGAGPYGDFVFETDHSIGQLLKAVADSGQADNTLVIFSADNGPEKYAYARDEKFDHWSAKPFRGLKRDIYEGGHHVPFIMKWPGKIAADATCDELVSQIDIFATIAAIHEVELPAKNAAEDSHNLLPLVTGKTDASPRTQHVHNTFDRAWAFRDGDHVLIQGKTGYHSGVKKEWEKKHGYPADNKADVELYNLKTDIGQRKDLAADHPELVKELQASLKAVRERGFSAPRLMPVAVDKTGQKAADAKPKHIVFLYGKRSHSSGAHEFKAGSHLLAKCLEEQDVVAVKTTVLPGWPADQLDVLDSADAIIFYNDATRIVGQGWEKVDALAKKGTGLMFMHYAVHPSVEHGEKYFKPWMGAYFKNGESVNPMWKAKIKPSPTHEAGNGVKPSETIDEYYHSLNFCADCGVVHEIGTATPTRKNLLTINNLWNPVGYENLGTELPLVWGFERKNGRGAGFTGGHFHHNWAYDELRQLVLNTIVWVAGAEVPEDGVPVRPITEDELNANLDDYGDKTVRLALPSPETRPKWDPNEVLTVEQHRKARKENPEWIKRKGEIIRALIVPVP